MRWFVDLLSRLRHGQPSPPPAVDRMALRDEMKRTDPDFARVSRVQHDALNALGAKSISDGLAVRRERQFWEQHPS